MMENYKFDTIYTAQFHSGNYDKSNGNQQICQRSPTSVTDAIYSIRYFMSTEDKYHLIDKLSLGKKLKTKKCDKHGIN